jgi:hypothetical protein
MGVRANDNNLNHQTGDTMNQELTAAQIVAITKAIPAKVVTKAKADLGVGDHDVDVTVRVTGSIKRGLDYSQKIVAKADPWLLLGVALSHLNGVTVDSIVREALTADPELVKSLKKTAQTALDAIKAPTDTDCSGKVTAKVAATVA